MKFQLGVLLSLLWSYVWAYHTHYHTTGAPLVRKDGLPLYGSTGVPEPGDLRNVQTKGGWFETTLAGFATFGREKIMQSLVPNCKNASRVDVMFPSRETVTVEARVWSIASPSVGWVAAHWDAVSIIFGEQGLDMSAYDTTSLANVWFSMISGAPGMRLQTCDSLDVTDKFRALYGASFNTPQGPETRMIFLFRYQERNDFTIISPKYPGVLLDTIPIKDDLVLDPKNQCMLLWSVSY
jgi:hypothetical protein